MKRERLRLRDEVDRIDRHHAQAVELLGRDHRADLGRDRRSGPAGDQQRGQHRPELAHQREPDHAAQALLRAEAHQRDVALQPEHAADHRTGEQHDRERQNPGGVDLVDQAPQPPRWSERLVDHSRAEDRDPAELEDVRDDLAPPPLRLGPA